MSASNDSIASKALIVGLGVLLGAGVSLFLRSDKPSKNPKPYQKLVKFHDKKPEIKDQKIVDHDEWIEARRALLTEEKNLTRHIDHVTQLRQELPWEKVAQDYVFDSIHGPVPLSSFFNAQQGYRDLIVYHLMFAVDDDNCCPNCASWVEGFSGYLPHLDHHRKVAFAAIGRASIEKIQAVANRKGWNFPYLSSGRNSFNVDFGVSPGPEDIKNKSSKFYNFGDGSPHVGSEFPGLSVFRLGLDNQIYHTYSTYARGLDMLNAGHMLVDTLPHGRNGFVVKEHLK